MGIIRRATQRRLDARPTRVRSRELRQVHAVRTQLRRVLDPLSSQESPTRAAVQELNMLLRHSGPRRHRARDQRLGVE